MSNLSEAVYIMVGKELLKLGSKILSERRRLALVQNVQLKP